jgi:hypothetical protein
MVADNGKRYSSAPLLLKWWIGYGALCSCAGWILSRVHQLNPAGYAVTAVVGALSVAMFSRRRKFRLPRRRFLHPLSAIFLLLAAGAFIGGANHPANNYDMLTYRLPRMLHWLAAGGWQWIHTYNQRMNYSATGWEWAATPLLLLRGNTSWFFLLNIISYLLLPGLLFAVLRQFGVSGRVAWVWMWLFPAGLNFVMQAGSGANDTISVVYLLAAIYFAGRARTHRSLEDCVWSAISAALLTGCKASNLPLMLPCAIALLPALPIMQRRPVATTCFLMVALFSSFAPNMALNFRFTHDWAGSPHDEGHLKIHNPIAGLIGNGLQLTVWNLQPPLMPGSGKVNDLMDHVLPGSVVNLLARDFPRFSIHLGEMPQEEGSGLGLAITVMVGISLVSAMRRATPTLAFPRRTGGGDRLWQKLTLVGGLLALLAFMCSLGSESAARLAAPYYLFLLIPLLLIPINAILVRRRWWMGCAILASLAGLPGLLLTPSRPLLPLPRIAATLAEKHPDSATAQRMETVYRVYADRADSLASLRRYLPTDAGIIGFVCSDDDSEVSLWLPLGSRKVFDLMPDDTAADLQVAGVKYIVVGAAGLAQRGSSIEEFLAHYGGKIIGQEKIIVKVLRGAEDWYVVDVGAAKG